MQGHMLLPEVAFTTDIITFIVLSFHYFAPAAIVMTRVGLKHRLRNMAQRCFAHLTFLNQTNKKRFAFDVFMRDLKVTPILYMAYFR